MGFKFLLISAFDEFTVHFICTFFSISAHSRQNCVCKEGNLNKYHLGLDKKCQSVLGKNVSYLYSTYGF